NKSVPRERKSRTKMVPTVVPSGAENGAIRLASETNESAADCTDEDGRAAKGGKKPSDRKPQTRGELCATSHRDALDCIAVHDAESKLRPTGFEPVTLGSEDRCAIQLRHGRVQSKRSEYGVGRKSTSSGLIGR